MILIQLMIIIIVVVVVVVVDHHGLSRVLRKFRPAISVTVRYADIGNTIRIHVRN